MSEGIRRREGMNKVTGEAGETARLSGNAVALQLVVRSFYHETLYLRWVLANSPFHDSNIPVSKPTPHPVQFGSSCLRIVSSQLFSGRCRCGSKQTTCLIVLKLCLGFGTMAAIVSQQATG